MAGKNKNKQPSKSKRKSLPWYATAGAMSGDKRLERQGIDADGLSPIEIMVQLKERIAQREREKQTQKPE
jgi:hypothetical protein